MFAQACLMQAQGSENDGGDADRGTDDAQDQPHQTECVTANFLFHRGCLLWGDVVFFVHELPGSMGQQRVLEHKFCHF